MIRRGDEHKKKGGNGEEQDEGGDAGRLYPILGGQSGLGVLARTSGEHLTW